MSAIDAETVASRAVNKVIQHGGQFDDMLSNKGIQSILSPKNAKYLQATEQVAESGAALFAYETARNSAEPV